MNGSSEVLQYTDNYPFGLEHNKVATFEELDPKNNYKYNAKEWNEELGLLDYGARWYDPAIARFGTRDRFSEKYYEFSNYGYAAQNPIKFIDVNGDSIRYGNAEIEAYIRTYISQTTTKPNGKVKRNKKYDAEFANVIQELESSEMVFHFTDDGSGLGENTLGAVSVRSDGGFDVVIPDHSGTDKSDKQAQFGGRGSILGEETYHASQVANGEVIAGNNGGFLTGTNTVAGAEIDAKIWTAERKFTKMSFNHQDNSIPSIPKMIKNLGGDRLQVFNFITQGATKKIHIPNKSPVTVIYSPSYTF